MIKFSSWNLKCIKNNKTILKRLEILKTGLNWHAFLRFTLEILWTVTSWACTFCFLKVSFVIFSMVVIKLTLIQNNVFDTRFYVSLLTDTTVSSEAKPLRTFAFSWKQQAPHLNPLKFLNRSPVDKPLKHEESFPS